MLTSRRKFYIIILIKKMRVRCVKEDAKIQGDFGIFFCLKMYGEYFCIRKGGRL